MEIAGHVCVLAWTDRRGGDYFDVLRDWGAAREKFDFVRTKCFWPKQQFETGIYLHDVSKYKSIAPPRGADVALFLIPDAEWHSGHMRFAWFEAPGGKAVTLLGNDKAISEWTRRLGHLRFKCFFLVDDRAREVLDAPPRFSLISKEAIRRSERALSEGSAVADLSRLTPPAMAGVVADLLIKANQSEADGLNSGAYSARQLALETAKLGFRLTGIFEFKNAQGSVHRRNGSWAESEAAFRQSIELCADAQANPHAYIGLAATLRRLASRRLNAWDEAYDLLKCVGRHYPKYELYLRTVAALKHDRTMHNKFSGGVLVGDFSEHLYSHSA